MISLSTAALEQIRNSAEAGEMASRHRVHRYEHDDKEIFRAGWVASQKRNHPAFKESVWVTAPVAPDEDPE